MRNTKKLLYQLKYSLVSGGSRVDVVSGGSDNFDKRKIKRNLEINKRKLLINHVIIIIIIHIINLYNVIIIIIIYDEFNKIKSNKN